MPGGDIFLWADLPSHLDSLTRSDRLFYVGVDALFSGVQVAHESATCELATQGKVAEFFRSKVVTPTRSVSA